MKTSHLASGSGWRRLHFAFILIGTVSSLVDLGAGTLYVAERSDGRVMAVDTLTRVAKPVASGLGSMIGAVVDRRGRLFVHRFGARSTALVNPANNTFVDIVTGVDGHGLGADPDSDTLYLAGYTSGVVYRIAEETSGTWTVETFISGLSEPIGVFQHGQILYVTDRDRRLYAKHLDTGLLETVTTLPAGGEMISREAGGDLIIGTIQGPVCRVDPVARKLVRTYTGFSNPAGVIVDPVDNTVIVCEHDGQRITRLNLETNARSTLTRLVAWPYQSAFAKMVELPLRLETPVLTGDALSLRWTGGPGVRLQSTTDLAAPDWQDVPASDGLSRMDLPLSNTQGFFRLHQP